MFDQEPRLTDANDINAIALLIASGKAALERAWEKRSSHRQNCEELLLESMRVIETCETFLSALNQDMGRPLCYLATTLLRCYQGSGDENLLVEAIPLSRLSLAFCGSGHSNRARSCFELARSLCMRYNSTGDDQLLTEAIDLQQESLGLCPPGHPTRAL
jgi:hypothetical protein